MDKLDDIKGKMSEAGDNNNSCSPNNKLTHPPSNGSQQNKRKLPSPLHLTAPIASTESDPVPKPSQWNDPLVHQLQSILICKAHAIFTAAVRRLVALGHPESAAQAAVSRTGFYRGGKDIAGNIAGDALIALKSGENGDCMDDVEFDDLMEMAEYTMVELVLVLVQAKPQLIVAEAMWWLLLFDMDIVQACGVDGDLVVELRGTEKSNSNSTPNKISEKVNHLKNLTASEPAKGKPPGKTVAAIVEETVASKGRKPLNKKELQTIQKVFGDQIDLSDNKTIVGSGLEEKKMKSPVKSLGVQKKESKSKSKSKNKPKGAAETTEVAASEPLNPVAGIYVDPSTGQYIPRNMKEEKILNMLCEIGKLNEDIQSWSLWANQKIMEVTARLNRDKPELALLKQEKELFEQLKKEQKMFVENVQKRVSDLQCSLVTAYCHFDLANDDIGKLKEELHEVFGEMQKARLLSVDASFNGDEAVEKEQETLKEVQPWNGKLSSLQEEIKTQKKNTAEVEQELTVSEKVQSRIRVKFEKQASEKEKLEKQVNAMKDEKEQLGASLLKEEKKVKAKAKTDMDKYEGVMELLSEELSELKLKVERSKIADLKRGMTGVEGHKGLSPEASQMRERECVMCMSVERDVVFYPCGHEILCKGCNEQHKGQGMKDCPSCRDVIVMRLAVKFPNN